MVPSSLDAQLLRVMFPLQQCLLLDKKKRLEKLIFYISILAKLEMKKRQFWGLAFFLSSVQCFSGKAQDGEKGGENI